MLSYLFVYILLTHWVADFVCQSDRIATNKSKSLTVLGEHIAIYYLVLGIAMIPIVILIGHPFAIFHFVVINALLQGVTDFFTSRVAANLHAKGDIHNFFVVIGLDQFIHAATLYVTYLWLLT